VNSQQRNDGKKSIEKVMSMTRRAFAFVNRFQQKQLFVVLIHHNNNTSEENRTTTSLLQA
jgi:hypothetical protein